MPVTHNELDRFHQFASRKLGNGGAESLRELVLQWEAEQTHEQSVASIRRSIEESEAGLDEPIEEAFAEVRKRLEQSK